MLVFKVNKTIVVVNTNNVHYKPNLNEFTIIQQHGHMVYINESLDIAGPIMRKFINPDYPYTVPDEVMVKYANTTMGLIMSWDELITVTLDSGSMVHPVSQSINEKGYFLVASNEYLSLYLQGALSYLMMDFDKLVKEKLAANKDVDETLDDATQKVEFNIIKKIIALYIEKSLCSPIGMTIIDLRDKENYTLMDVFHEGIKFDHIDFSSSTSSYVEVRKQYIESLTKNEETKHENTQNSKSRRSNRVSTRRRKE